MQKRMRKAFTLLELIVVVVVLGILALVAVPAFSGVIENSTGSVAENTAKAIARDANALAAFNSGADANVTANDDIKDALCETTLATSDGWAYAASTSGASTISLTKNGDLVGQYTISVSDGRAVVAKDTGAAITGTSGC